MSKMNWLDRALSGVAPRLVLERVKARRALDRTRAEYDGATQGRRAASWKRRSTDATAEMSPNAMAALRQVSHDLVRNNAFAARGVAGIAEHLVGPGIAFHVANADGTRNEALTALAQRHFESTACDAEGRLNLYGLQLVAARAMVTSGAALVRRRWRRIEDRLPVPMQIQLLEPDYIDMSLTGGAQNGRYWLAGIEFDGIGRRTAYRLYTGHPGSLLPGMLNARDVPASEVLHIYRADRPEQQHGAPWLAPVIVRLKDYGEYVDAQVVKQKVSSAFTAMVTGNDEADPAVDGNGNPVEVEPQQDYLEPGMISYLPPGSEVTFGSPPSVDGYREFSTVTLHEIASGLGIPFELMTGDLKEVSFISGRLGRLHFKRAVETWQWMTFIPQFCEPLGKWFLEAAAMSGTIVPPGAHVVWSPPRFEMMDPASEISAEVAEIRAGLASRSSKIRARGEDPALVMSEIVEENAAADRDGLVFDSDARRVTQAGNAVTIPNAEDRSRP